MVGGVEAKSAHATHMQFGHDCPGAYRVFQQWLALAGLLLFAFYLLWDMALLQTLLATDRSYLSGLILGGFLLATVHVGWRAHALGRETCLAERLRRRLAQVQWQQDGRDELLALPSDGSYAHEHLGFLIHRARHGDPRPAQELLLERLGMQVRSGHESGWFVADLMLKLGLLGTVIGFIFMLSAVTGINQVDIRTLQQLMTNMSSGMQVALYTTLAGLTAGMLLGLQYQFLDRASDQLLAILIEISEVHLPRHLEHLFADRHD